MGPPTGKGGGFGGFGLGKPGKFGGKGDFVRPALGKGTAMETLAGVVPPRMSLSGVPLRPPSQVEDPEAKRQRVGDQAWYDAGTAPSQDAGKGGDSWSQDPSTWGKGNDGWDSSTDYAMRSGATPIPRPQVGTHTQPLLQLRGAQPPPVPLPGASGAWPGTGPPFQLSVQQPPAMPPQMQSLGLQQALPVQVFLAPATKNIVPQSSKQSQNKQIAMQFLSADREAQTQMLRDPNVARAILQTLGESKPPGPAPPPVVTSTAVVVSTPAVEAPSPTAAAAGGSNLQWSGKMTLARSMGKQLNNQATLLHGKVQAVELALRIAAEQGGVLNISHRVPFDDLARRTPAAILALAPLVLREQGQYDEYVKYFRSKTRVGVARLDEEQALYLVPPCEQAEELLTTLQAGGAPALPRHCLLGVIAATPGPASVQAAPVTAPSAARPVKTEQPTVATPEKAAEPVAEAKVEDPKNAPAEEAPAEDKGKSDGADKEMSQEALLDLFSNPDLLRSLQSVEDPVGD